MDTKFKVGDYVLIQSAVVQVRSYDYNMSTYVLRPDNYNSIFTPFESINKIGIITDIYIDNITDIKYISTGIPLYKVTGSFTPHWFDENELTKFDNIPESHVQDAIYIINI